MDFKRPNRHRQPPASVLRRDAPALDIPSRPTPNSSAPSAPVRKKPTPTFTLPLLSRVLPLSKKSAALGIAGMVVLGLAAWGIANANSNAGVKSPTYQTILPKGKTITELGGWKRVSPPNDQPVFAYADVIDGVAISVTEQPLPQSFKSDIDGQVAELAKKFNASDKIDAGSTAAYVGTSAKGPQSVILASSDLLILIKSEKKISDASWTKYAASLVK